MAATGSARSTCRFWLVAVSLVSRSSQEVEKGLGRGEREGLAWHCQTTRKCGTVAAVRALRRIAMGYTVEKGRRVSIDLELTP